LGVGGCNWDWRSLKKFCTFFLSILLPFKKKRNL
jgi:hypothetical protein